MSGVRFPPNDRQKQGSEADVGHSRPLRAKPKQHLNRDTPVKWKSNNPFNTSMKSESDLHPNDQAPHMEQEGARGDNPTSEES